MLPEILPENIWAADPFWSTIDDWIDAAQDMHLQHAGTSPDLDDIEDRLLYWWIENALPAGVA